MHKALEKKPYKNGYIQILWGIKCQLPSFWGAFIINFIWEEIQKLTFTFLFTEFIKKQSNHRHIADYDNSHENKFERFIFHLPIIIGSKSFEEPCFFKNLGSNSVDKSELDAKNRKCYKNWCQLINLRWQDETKKHPNQAQKTSSWVIHVSQDKHEDPWKQGYQNFSFEGGVFYCFSVCFSFCFVIKSYFGWTLFNVYLYCFLRFLNWGFLVFKIFT